MLSEKAKEREQKAAQYDHDPYGDDPETDDDAMQLPDSTIAFFKEVLDRCAIPSTLLAVASVSA